jgi:predicted nucleic acid-binding protein
MLRTLDGLVANYSPKNKRQRILSLSQLADPITDIELGVQENDLCLASQAIATEAVLVTFDRMTHVCQAARATGLELLFAEW